MDVYSYIGIVLSIIALLVYVFSLIFHELHDNRYRRKKSEIVLLVCAHAVVTAFYIYTIATKDMTEFIYLIFLANGLSIFYILHGTLLTVMETASLYTASGFHVYATFALSLYFGGGFSVIAACMATVLSGAIPRELQAVYMYN